MAGMLIATFESKITLSTPSNRCLLYSVTKIHAIFHSQMDMHELIEEQMKRQLNEGTFKTRQPITTTTAAPKKTYRLLGLFQR